MNETYRLVDPNILTWFRDTQRQIDLFDMDGDERLSKSEFLIAVNQTLFYLVLEDCLTSPDPYQYL